LSACVLDTDVVIAALDRGDAHHRRAASALTAMIEARVELLLSTVNYAEALVRPAAEESMLSTAVEAIADLGVRLVAPTPAIAHDAALVRGQGVSLPDGFALATAKAERASLASFDRRVKRVLPAVGIVLAADFA
jgi:predicted nucleic acid-binding protein